MPKPVKRDENTNGQDVLKPYDFHGIQLAASRGNPKEYIGECFSCGREEKFSLNTEKERWRCFSCGDTGNQYEFVRTLWKMADDATSEKEYASLGELRKLRPETLMEWGIAKSPLTNNWLVPGFNVDNKLCSLYRFMKFKDGWKLLPTPTLGGQMFGVDLFDVTKSTVYLCEGPWDGMALYETLSQATYDSDEIISTSNRARSLLADSNVIGVPGCQTFNDKWTDLFANKIVVICFDNDHPRKHPRNGRLIPPAGLEGAKRTAGILSASKTPPEEIHFLAWGGTGIDADLPAGYDLRDMLNASENKIGQLRKMFSLIKPIPEEWVQASKSSAKAKSQDIVECEDYRKLVQCWRKALRWTQGLDHALTSMLAVITSTQAVGDQLWMKIIGPASCGKSTLCEAVSTNTQYVLPKSTMRGFHSGYGDGEEDNSLLARLYGMTLVTKDGDTLLQSPNLGQILSEARDVYDGVSRTHYRNKNSKDYEGLRMTWLLCGTSSLRSIDSSELGERFLDCVIMDGIDADFEDAVSWRVANRASKNMSIESNGSADKHYEPELVDAMKMTGGYVEYLRTFATKLLTEVESPPDMLKLCARLGIFVAYMRARPSSMQEETAEREFSARLVSQLVRLAKSTAVVMNRKAIDAEVMSRVKKVALDTARGMTYEICEALYTSSNGLETKALSLSVTMPDAKLRELLRFLRCVGAVKLVAEKKQGMVKKRWHLSDRVQKLFNDVHPSL